MKQGKALKENPQIAKWYDKEIQKLLKEMFSATRLKIEPNFKKLLADEISSAYLIAQLSALSDDFYEYFKKNGRRLAKKFLDKQIRQARLNAMQALEPIANKDLSFMIKGSLITESNKALVEMAIYNNVTLIKSISDQYFKEITGAVARSMEVQGSLKQLIEFLTHYEGISKKRAKLIAYDQTRKVHSDLTLQAMKDAGFNKVKWVHSNAGKEPRHYHIAKWDGVSGKEDGHPNGLNGFVYDIDNPPIIEDAYEPKTERGTYRPPVRGHPAQLVNCRCFLVPVRE